MKSFESIGIWFLPGAPDRHVAGTITFSKDEGIRLVLSGSLQKDRNIEQLNYPLIHGVVSNSPYGRFLSLFDGFTTHLRIGMPGVSIEKIHANYGYAGSDHVDSGAMLFNAASLSFSALGAWLNYSGLKVDYDQGEVTAKWEQPEKSQGKVAGATVSAALLLKTEGGPRGHSITLGETPTFSVRDFREMTANEIDSTFAGPLSMLMTFALDSPSEFDFYQLYTGETESASHFNRLYAPAGERSKSKSSNESDPLFTLADVPGGFEPFLQAWFEFVRTRPNFCRMFFTSGYQKHGFVETRFLLVMQALECLLQDETPEDSDELEPFKRVRQTLLAADGFADQPYARTSVATAVQLAMPTLFFKLVNDNWRLIQHVVGTSKEHFLDVLFATFNYVMNRGNRPAEVAGANFFWLHQRLGAVIKIYLLNRLQFTDEKITQIVARNDNMRHLRSINDPWERTSDQPDLL